MHLSQDEFAAALRAAGARMGETNNASKRLVQRWEADAGTTVRPIYRRALEQVTGRPFERLGFGRGGAGPAGADRSELSGRLPRFAEQEPVPGAAIGPEYVATLAARTARLRRLDDYLGGTDTFELYHNEVQATALALRSCSYSPRTGDLLVGILAEQTQQAGWVAFDTGSHALAEQLYRYSLTAAREIGDHALAGNALALLAYQANQTGRPSVQIAQTACTEAGKQAPPAVHVLLAQRLAWAHATAGETRRAQQALGAAEAYLARRQTGPVPDWAGWADEREQRIIEGRCWVELGRPTRAAGILEDALAAYDDGRARNKALFLTWLAAAYLDARELDAAAATLLRATQLAAEVASPRLAARIRAVSRRFRPHRSHHQVRQLLELWEEK